MVCSALGTGPSPKLFWSSHSRSNSSSCSAAAAAASVARRRRRVSRVCDVVKDGRLFHNFCQVLLKKAENLMSSLESS